MHGIYDVNINEHCLLSKVLKYMIIKHYNVISTWLMMNLFLRKLRICVMPLEQCKVIASELQVTDLEEALWAAYCFIQTLKN